MTSSAQKPVVSGDGTSTGHAQFGGEMRDMLVSVGSAISNNAEIKALGATWDDEVRPALREGMTEVVETAILASGTGLASGMSPEGAREIGNQAATGADRAFSSVGGTEGWRSELATLGGAATAAVATLAIAPVVVPTTMIGALAIGAAGVVGTVATGGLVGAAQGKSDDEILDDAPKDAATAAAGMLIEGGLGKLAGSAMESEGSHIAVSEVNEEDARTLAHSFGAAVGDEAETPTFTARAFETVEDQVKSKPIDMALDQSYEEVTKSMRAGLTKPANGDVDGGHSSEDSGVGGSDREVSVSHNEWGDSDSNGFSNFQTSYVVSLLSGGDSGLSGPHDTRSNEITDGNGVAFSGSGGLAPFQTSDFPSLSGGVTIGNDYVVPAPATQDGTYSSNFDLTFPQTSNTGIAQVRGSDAPSFLDVGGDLNTGGSEIRVGDTVAYPNSEQETLATADSTGDHNYYNFFDAGSVQISTAAPSAPAEASSPTDLPKTNEADSNPEPLSSQAVDPPDEIDTSGWRDDNYDGGGDVGGGELDDGGY